MEEFVLAEVLVRLSTLLADIGDLVVDNPHMSHCCFQQTSSGRLRPHRAAVYPANYLPLTVSVHTLHVLTKVIFAILFLTTDLANMMFHFVVSA